MKLIVMKNSELDEPFTYKEWDYERNTWVGLDPYNLENVIPGYVCITEEGDIYLFDEKREILVPDQPPIGQNEWDEWACRLYHKDYPSAYLIDEEPYHAIHVRLPSAMYEKLAAFARYSKRSVAKMVEHIIEKYIQNKLFPED